MGRRSDHNREELEQLILSTAGQCVEEHGLANFSAREVARRIGYSVGTILNLFGTSDRLISAVNTRSFGLWAGDLRKRLAEAGDGDRIAALVNGYFEFARQHGNLWAAIYDHRLPPDSTLSDVDHEARGQLTEIVVAEVARALGREPDERIGGLSRSLIATVHGHCSFAVSGAWALMGEAAPEVAALARVREALAGQALAGQS